MAEYKFKERDEDNLNLILDYCDRIIERTTAVKDLKEFSENAVLRDAILMNIIQIGEYDLLSRSQQSHQPKKSLDE